MLWVSFSNWSDILGLGVVFNYRGPALPAFPPCIATCERVATKQKFTTAQKNSHMDSWRQRRTSGELKITSRGIDSKDGIARLITYWGDT